ncbi:MAG: hypothetical protein H6727_00260 [Myxococcales bacterium]|nr:hypothetical protein [Myxococcales bacterium]
MSGRLGSFFFVSLFLVFSFLGCECTPKPPLQEIVLDGSVESPLDGASESLSDNEPSLETNQENTPEPFVEGLPEQGAHTVAGICKFIGQTLCGSVFSCCGDKGLIFRDQAACIGQFEQGCLGNQPALLETAMKEGALRVSETNLQGCVQAFDEAGKRCGTPDEAVLRGICAGIFQATAKIGEECKSTLDGMFCDDGQGQCFPTPLGTPCKRWSKDGEYCKDGPCAPGLFCWLGEEPATCRSAFAKDSACSASAQCQKGLTCLQQKCVSQIPKGSSCDGVAQCQADAGCDPSQRQCVERVGAGKSCTFAEHCQVDLFCDGTSHTGLVCKIAKKEGESCSNTKDCDKDLFCKEMLCAKLPTQGQTCDPILSIGCSAPFVCDKTTSKCVALPQQDQPCLSGQSPCAEGLACFQTAQGARCQPKHAKDQACEDDTSCQTGLGCSAQKLCVALPTAGQSCHNDFFCASGLFCDLNTKQCATAHQLGESCDIGNECAANLTCLMNTQKQKRCVALPQQGEACQLACASGLVCRPGVGSGTCVPALCKGLLAAAP